MSKRLVELVRQRCWHGISETTVSAGGLHDVAELQRFIAGTLVLSDRQIAALALWFNIDIGNTKS